MIILVGFILFVLLLWSMSASAKRRKAEAKLELLAAYAAGLTDATAPPQAPEPPPMRHPEAGAVRNTDAPAELAFRANRVKPTPESRRLGYWVHPPCDIVGDEEIHGRLATLG